MLEWGNEIDFFNGMPDGFIPPALINQPVLIAENEEYIDAFNQLNSSRVTGFSGPEPIMIAEIKAYVELFEIDDIPYFFKAIKACDAIFRKHNQSK